MVKGILLETDGQPNYGVGNANDYTCWQANQNATAVKATGIQIYTVGFGLDGSNDVNCPDASGTHDSAGKTFYHKTATALLASMASPLTSGAPSPDLGCPSPGNILTAYPGVHAFCEVKSTDGNALLANVFQYIAVNLASGGLHLVNLYPTPVVTGVTSGAAPVTITGKFLTGATSVTFGGTAWKVLTNTDIDHRPAPRPTASYGHDGRYRYDPWRKLADNERRSVHISLISMDAAGGEAATLHATGLAIK